VIFMSFKLLVVKLSVVELLVVKLSVVELYADIHSLIPLHTHTLLRAYALECLSFNRWWLMPWNVYYSTVEGLCPGMLVIQTRKMVPHAYALFHCRCSSLCHCIVVVVDLSWCCWIVKLVSSMSKLLLKLIAINNVVNEDVYVVIKFAKCRSLRC